MNMMHFTDQNFDFLRRILRNCFFFIAFIITLSSFTFKIANADPTNENPYLSDDEVLSNYETELPNNSNHKISKYERRMLISYLEHPTDFRKAIKLARLHMFKMRRWHYYKEPGIALKHAILAQYFINRSKALGSRGNWLSYILNQTQKNIDDAFQFEGVPSIYEGHPAHIFYRDTFHFNEENRYLALNRLLSEFVTEPNNVYTSFAITAINLWIGGETDYDDPTVLYNFILGSYFSFHTIELARSLEESWVNDPVNTSRFRMSSILGGFSLLQRRWLAALHNDDSALALIDDEHRQWRIIHRSFHAFTLGIPFFEEPENFNEGLFAIVDGFAHCDDDLIRTCLNRPRFAFNNLSFVLTLIDFFLKAGDIESAEQTLQFRFSHTEVENWATWDLGREPWLHRENNLDEIIALYQNDDPTDDPLHFQIKPKKWGTNTTTCQTCHQSQGHNWSENEFNSVLLPPESVATVGNWPEFSTTWWAKAIDSVDSSLVK